LSRLARVNPTQPGVTPKENMMTDIPDTTDTTDTPDVPDVDTTGDTGDTTTEQPGRVDDLPEWARKLIRDTRAEAATKRSEKNAAVKAAETDRQKLITAFAKAAGIDIPGETPNPEELATQLTAAQDTARAARVQLAVYKAATAAGGNPDALLDSTTFLAKVNSLDPTAPTFGDNVGEAIRAAITANPTLKRTQAVAPSTTVNTGGTGEAGQITEDQLAQMTPEQIEEAYQKGHLKHLMG